MAVRTKSSLRMVCYFLGHHLGFLDLPIHPNHAKDEIKGSDAMRLPSKGNFLETSEIRTMTTAVRPSLIKYQVMELPLHECQIKCH